MELATGALGALLPQLAELLRDEYKLQKNVRKDIEFLQRELECTHAALLNVGDVPPEQLDHLSKIWARDVRELSYDMEAVVDTFLVRGQSPDPPGEWGFKWFIQKMNSMLATIGEHHRIGKEIRDIKERVIEVGARRKRYKFDTVNHVTPVDPRIKFLHAKATELVGIDEARKEIIIKMTKGDDMSTQLVPKIVSIVGFGGLGKTTLAKAVYDEMKSQFDCTAFVTVSRNPDMKELLKDMFYELSQEYGKIDSKSLHHLINLVRGFISNKRYFIVIDDIWDISNWDIIKCALPDDNTGCKIITTTRNVEVANYVGGAYEMKPLSSNSSRVLLYRRIFGNQDPERYLNEELAEVSHRILKRCAGVPLAIITIASLLASKGRNKTEWDDIYNSIGNGLENNLDVENMRKILSYSYYDLSCDLRTCLLYLSMFPEDAKIPKDCLIWLWIAEGFIKCREQESPFELGESYFNKLINRSMIEPIYEEFDASLEIEGCHVHDMVYDLICSLSREQNFVGADRDQTSTATTLRRLSLQHGKVDHGSTRGTKSIPQVRSFLVFSSDIDQMPALQSFKILRVLHLQGFDLSKGYSLKYLCSLFHLRYLNLSMTSIVDLPEEVGNLQFLQTLDVSYNWRISCLPSTVTQLKHLMCLNAENETMMPNGIGSLKSLEVLSCFIIDEESRDNVEALGLLTQLRVLDVVLRTTKWNDKLAESLRNLRKIQYLKVWSHDEEVRRDNVLGAWDPPRHLRRLDTRYGFWFSELPPWPSHLLRDLSRLDISVTKLRQEDLLVLGRLPSLLFLSLVVNHVELGINGRLLAGAGSFPCLLRCDLTGFATPLMFQQGAMPRLRTIYYSSIPAAVLDFSLENLPSLEDLVVSFRPGSASEEEVQEAKDAVTEEAEIHPNRPSFSILLSPPESSHL